MEEYNGFRIEQKEYIQEINGNVYIMTHVGTGAKVIWVNNDDEHQGFSIGFRTPAMDDTGVFHILEHCVLSGSKKYPVKEPIVELMKGSMKTYLNASTYPDKTLFSLASVNKKDFSNMMDVFLDAVFFPKLHEQKEIFLQEGWHLAYSEETNELIYKGIVYNEMKGTLSSPQQRFIHSLFKALYPSFPHANFSGGDPKEITNLTYEKLLEAHRDYYHPSNSLLYLYGAMDIEERLQQLNEVLGQFERKENKPLALDKIFEGERKEFTSEYPISEKEIEEENTFLAFACKVEEKADENLGITLNVLNKILLEGNSAILRKKLLEEKLGKDAFGLVDSSLKYPLFAICCSNGDAVNKDMFIKIVQDTLRELVEKGIDKKLIEAAILSTEFELREADYGTFPEGLFHGINAASNWAAGKPLIKAFQYEDSLETVKSALSEPYFERFIENYLLNGKQSAIVVCKPSKQLSNIEYLQEQVKLKRIKDGMKEADLQALIQENAELNKFQSISDSDEAKETLPTLLLSDIDPKPADLPLQEIECNGSKVLFHDIYTKKVVYYNLYFDAINGKDDISYYRLFTELLGKLGTSEYTSEALASEIAMKIGIVSFENYLYSSSVDTCLHKVAVKVRTMEKNMEKSLKLVHHILTETEFDNKKKVKELIGNLVSNMKIQLNSNGNMFAAIRVNSSLTALGYINEHLRGISFYQFLVKLEKDFEQRYDSFIQKMKGIANNLFCRKNLVVGLTGDLDAMKVFSNAFLNFDLPDGNKVETFEFQINNDISKEAFTNSNSILYVVQGGNLKKMGYEFSGQMLVLAKILNLTYLWRNLRVLGGAYGGGINIYMNGNIFFYSYRDPNLLETVDIYNTTSDFIMDLDLPRSELQRYIIGTIADLDNPMNARIKGEQAETNYFINNTYEQRLKVRQEVINTTIDDLRSLSEMFKALLGKQSLCVVGNERKIAENNQLFDYSYPLFS
ncbi:insulinase family protein [Bacillus sp. PK3-056]|uniref:insulinase family protein n=1 Tax=Niallia circulans TaxID=1397 RepID=UPI000F4498CE|nr:insulinase family protein [Niallia circulans]AYV73965.1 hypothetical protein C2H98_21705 [Niallia circulans]